MPLKINNKNAKLMETFASGSTLIAAPNEYFLRILKKMLLYLQPLPQVMLCQAISGTRQHQWRSQQDRIFTSEKLVILLSFLFESSVATRTDVHRQWWTLPLIRLPAVLQIQLQPSARMTILSLHYQEEEQPTHANVCALRSFDSSHQMNMMEFIQPYFTFIGWMKFKVPLGTTFNSLTIETAKKQSLSHYAQIQTRTSSIFETPCR